MAGPNNLVNLPENNVPGFNTKTTSVIWANNTTGVVIKDNAGLVFGVRAFNNSSTIAYLKFYNTATAPTTADTVIDRFMIPGPASAGGGGFIAPMPNGKAYSTGISIRVSTGIADADTGSPAASTYLVSIDYK